MNLKQFKPQKSPWGFRVEFDCGYGFGQDQLIELIGPRKDPNRKDPLEWRWYMVQDIPWRMRRKGDPKEQEKNGQFHKDEWRKGTIYVFDEQVATFLKLLCTT